ncbi:MAG: DnaD domain protein, partial [Opitutales bacterium]|nr:DnaD domain protein [Opitutales bacterium]
MTETSVIFDAASAAGSAAAGYAATLLAQLFAGYQSVQKQNFELLKQKTEYLKLFAKIQEVCGAIRKTPSSLSSLSTWKEWRFSDEMILEAAKRSCSSASPIPYMNKILSEWKEGGVYALNDIPEGNLASSAKGNQSRSTYVSEAVKTANEKTDRERYYARLREKAQSVADGFLAKANKNA